MAPIRFEPIMMERVWGGRVLETRLGKHLPTGARIGESWELVDRPEAQSVVHEGVYRGKTLHDLWTSHRAEIFGQPYLRHRAERFPMLIKLLDAREKLSVQVHPPAALAAALGGEPKTEMWYFLACDPGAAVYAGLAAGVGRDQFEQALSGGQVEHLLHRISVTEGRSLFIPSGRIHAIGEGNVIVEVQQNSDTTYRVFDWNRTGLDGRARQLHLSESLASIDFGDYEPGLTSEGRSVLASCPWFKVEKFHLESPASWEVGGKFALVVPVKGKLKVGESVLQSGEFALLPASLEMYALEPVGAGTEFLFVTLPVT